MTLPQTRSQRFRRFMEDLKIRSERGTIVNMRFSASQEILWSYVAPRLDRNERLWFICLKGRQVYASTFFEALSFTRTIEQPGTHTKVLAQDLDSSHVLFNMAKRFLDYLPMPKLLPAKAREIIFPFPNGASKFQVISAGVAAKGRGSTETCIHASEVAFWQHPQILTGLFQVMPDVDDTLWVMESTANGKVGVGEMFYSEWQRAIAGDSFLTPIFIPWYAMPKYRGSAIGRSPVPEAEWDEEEKVLVNAFGVDGDQLAWRRYAIKTKCQGQVAFFHQEYPSTPEEAFISSGRPAFNHLSLMQLRKGVREPEARGSIALLPDKTVAFTKDPRGEVRIWRFPEDGHKYAIGADTASGLDTSRTDYSCAQIIDMGTLEQVASVHGHIPPFEFAATLNALGLWYNKAIVIVELNNHGEAVQDYLIRVHQYPYLHPWLGRPDKISYYRPRAYGWVTNAYSRPLMIEAGRRVIDDCLVTLHEAKLIDECYAFSSIDGGKYEATGGHDDRVIALLLALRTREENYFPAKPKISISEDTLPSGVRIVQSLEGHAAERRKVAEELRKRAKNAVKSWLSM